MMFVLSANLFGNACGGDSSSDLDTYSRGLKEEFPALPTISTSVLAGLAKQPALLDVRSEEEFAVSHLPGAIRAEDNLVEQLARLAIPKNAALVVYCSVGYRSALAAQKLSAAGYENIRNLEGSIFAWANEGRTLVNAHGPTTKCHPYSHRWGRYLDRSKWQWSPD